MVVALENTRVKVAVFRLSVCGYCNVVLEIAVASPGNFILKSKKVVIFAIAIEVEVAAEALVTTVVPVYMIIVRIVFMIFFISLL